MNQQSDIANFLVDIWVTMYSHKLQIMLLPTDLRYGAPIDTIKDVLERVWK